MGTHPREILGI